MGIPEITGFLWGENAYSPKTDVLHYMKFMNDLQTGTHMDAHPSSDQCHC